MPVSEKITKSKENINHIQSINLSSDLYNMLNEIEKRKKDNDYLLSIPILIVSSIESYFKSLFSNLIDFDNIYLENSKKLIKRNNIKLDIEDIFFVTKSKYSLGDLIAYSLKYSSIESLYKTFNEITGINIFSHKEYLTKIISDGFELDDVINEDRPIDNNRIFKNLKELYEIRNIICHDFLSTKHKLNLDFEFLKECIKDAFVLQEIISIYCSEKIYSKEIPIDNKERKKYYENILKEKIELLNEYNNQFIKAFKGEIQEKNVEKNIKAFENYLENDSKYLVTYFTDLDESLKVTFDPIIIKHKIKLIEQRIKNIENEIEYSYSS